MHRSYYVAVIRHDKVWSDEARTFHWIETETHQYGRPMDAKFKADELNDEHRTPTRFYSARMKWLNGTNRNE